MFRELKWSCNSKKKRKKKRPWKKMAYSWYSVLQNNAEADWWCSLIWWLNWQKSIINCREGPCRSKLLSFLLSKGLVLLPICLQFQLYPLFFLLQSLDLKHNKLTVFSNMLRIWQQPLTKWMKFELKTSRICSLRL